MRLLETLEMHMIGEVRKRVAKELTLALAERAREETALPTDLWKRAVSNHPFCTQVTVSNHPFCTQVTVTIPSVHRLL